MSTGMRFIQRIILIVFAALLALPGSGLAQPNVTAYSFTPPSIDTSASGANVTVNFSLTDAGAGISYFETGLVDPGGAAVLRASKTYGVPATSVTDSVLISFPQFSTPGTW